MKNNGSFYRILIAPVRRSAVIIGQLPEAVLVSFLEVGMLVLVSLLYGVRIQSGPAGMLMMLILLFVSAFFYSCVAYTISLHLPNEVIYETVMNAVVLPLFFLSSALFPADSLSGALAVAVKLNPYTHVINILRALVAGSKPPILAFAGTAALFLLLCAAGYVMAYKSLMKQTLQ